MSNSSNELTEHIKKPIISVFLPGLHHHDHMRQSESAQLEKLPNKLPKLKQFNASFDVSHDVEQKLHKFLNYSYDGSLLKRTAKRQRVFWEFEAF